MDRLDQSSSGELPVFPRDIADERLAWHASGNYSLVEVSLSFLYDVGVDHVAQWRIKRVSSDCHNRAHY